MPSRCKSQEAWKSYGEISKRDGEKCALCGYEPDVMYRHGGLSWEGRRAPRPVPYRARKSLEVDHIDGNTGNNNLNNLRLLCSDHNKAEYWRRKVGEPLEPKRGGITVCVRDPLRKSVGKVGLEGLRVFNRDFENDVNAPIEQRRARKLKVTFEAMVEKLTIEGELTKKDAIYWLASELGCSSVTTDRYLREVTTARGKFQEIENEKGMVIIVKREKEEKC